MGALQVVGPDTPFVNSAEEMAGRFSAELALSLETGATRTQWAGRNVLGGACPGA